ncbi:MAG TPA: ABC transporter ATP-binding protein [Anaerolineales bacterium]|nr:ABC transporter ATP-binding protein [Anaerolineales bacterium]
MTVWENLNFAASLYGVGMRRGKNLMALLDFVELVEDRHELASQLSGGMQRRLSLAATLVHNPDLIFLDEPTAGIDPILRSKFWDHFNEMKHAGRSLFVTTQYVSEAAYCDVVGIMSEGNLVAVDTPEGLRKGALGGDIVVLRSTGWISHDSQLRIEDLPFVNGRLRRTGDNGVEIIVEEASTAIPQLMEWANQNNLQIESVEESIPLFDDVFVKVIEAHRNEQNSSFSDSCIRLLAQRGGGGIAPAASGALARSGAVPYHVAFRSGVPQRGARPAHHLCRIPG